MREFEKRRNFHSTTTEDGLRDMAGYCVLFTPQAFAGPARPSMETTPAKYAKKALPSKGSREMRKAKMAYQAHWSEKEGIDTDL